MVVAAAKMAKEKGVIVILDPAPVQALPEEIYPNLDIITPNETEAEMMVGFPIRTREDAASAAKIFKARGVQNVIIKMGSRGSYALMGGAEKFFSPFQVTPVDTVAAGDAFNGALGVAISENRSIEEAIRWGMAGGALSVTKEGAQPAMPIRNELLTLIETQHN
jgi:ribokinase